MKLIGQIISLYAWVVIAVLFLFLYRIARFYERKSRQRTHYRLFLVPIVLLAFGALRYAFFSADFVGDPPGDAAFFAGGTAAYLLGFSLLDLMTGPKR
jgi:hypothetical protein